MGHNEENKDLTPSEIDRSIDDAFDKLVSVIQDKRDALLDKVRNSAPQNTSEDSTGSENNNLTGVAPECSEGE